MDLFPSSFTLFDQNFLLSLRELILLFFLFYQLGYYFGKKKNTQLRKTHRFFNLHRVLPLQSYQKNDPSQHTPKNEQQFHHSLKLVKEISHSLSDFPQPIDSQSDKIKSQKLITPKTEEQFSRDILSEKINLKGKKIQSRGIFQMTFEKAENPKFLRKIQKHQIITDYEVPQCSSSNCQIIHFGSKKFFQFTDECSILQISTYENFRLQKYPIIEKKLIKTHEFAQYEDKNQGNILMSASLCENGKFDKFFKNQKKIGEGAFGVVYSVKNIFEGKEYAVKKLFIKSGLGKNRMENILKESIKEVNIISQYNHPNIIRFHTCWLEIANLNESINFNKKHFRQYSENDYSILQSSKELNFKKKKSGDECVQISYISSQNSVVAFEHSVKKGKLNSSKKTIKIEPRSDLHVVSVQIKQNSLSHEHGEKPFSGFAPVFALYIQMQLCPQGSLDRYLHQRKHINRSFVFIVIDQLLHGVQYLHLNGLVHRDLKPGNILIHKKEKLIKIGDFGLSVRIHQEIQYGQIGTPSYIAPEILQKKIIRKEEIQLIDVYSVGVIFYELLNLFNQTTKHEKIQKISKLKEGKVDLPYGFNQEKKLIKLMTKSVNRLSIKQIFQRKQYLQLLNLVNQDTDVLKSWQNIEGLENIQ